jgi:protein gp37
VLSRLNQLWQGRRGAESPLFKNSALYLLRSTPAAIKFLSVEPLLEHLGEVDLRGIDWVIVGGESGPGARPLKAEWVLDLRDQCERAGVAFFFKQWGGVRKHRTGRLLDGQTYDGSPAVSANEPPTRKRRLEMLDELAA